MTANFVIFGSQMAHNNYRQFQKHNRVPKYTRISVIVYIYVVQQSLALFISLSGAKSYCGTNTNGVYTPRLGGRSARQSRMNFISTRQGRL